MDDLGLNIQQEGDWWVGWLDAVPGVIAQERTREELLISLEEALKDIQELETRQP